MKSEGIADLIRLFHILIILFILIAPFTGSLYLLIVHIFLCISLFVHWYNNNDECSLSIMESRIRGLHYTESTTHKFVSGMYNISKTDWSNIVWILTIVLFCISIYNLYSSHKWKLIKSCLGKAKVMNDRQEILQCIRYFFT